MNEIYKKNNVLDLLFYLFKIYEYDTVYKIIKNSKIDESKLLNLLEDIVIISKKTHLDKIKKLKLVSFFNIYKRNKFAEYFDNINKPEENYYSDNFDINDYFLEIKLTVYKKLVGIDKIEKLEKN